MPRVRLRLGRWVDRPELRPQLVDLAAEVAERLPGVLVLEADGGCAPLHLLRMKQCRERVGDVVKDPRPVFLLALQLLPAPLDRSGGFDRGIGEDVGMAPYELRLDLPRGRGQVSLARLLEQERQEEHLEQEIAQLVEQLHGLPCQRGVGHLVGLLDGVGHDRARGLRPVPRALAAQALGQSLEIEKRGSEIVPAAHTTGPWSRSGRGPRP